MTNETRAISWDHTSLSVKDLDSAIRFYESAFGFSVVFEARGLTGQAASITGTPGMELDVAHLVSPLSPHRLELIQFSAPGGQGAADASGGAPTAPGAGHVSFVVEDLEHAIAAVQALGARQLGAVTSFAEGRSAYLMEPSGTVIELEEGSAPELALLRDPIPRQGHSP